MKKPIVRGLIIPGLIVSIFLFSGCATVMGPAIGTIYTDTQAPLAVTSNAVGSKVGSAEAKSILGIVAIGDASVQAAAKQGGITRISHVDYKSYSILGVYAKITVYVYGD